ncbi:MAG TPA: hypothetical protein PLT64_01405 [Syntrophales bacterium]|nr:hypothetical protein [Syntrophales bacterium]HOL58507.1 hypothetical protein [Syntrophales bacterium]HPO34885.1 hypothetical protein [Syntrophales bacterium]
MQAIVTLTPAESKRLIAKGIVKRPDIDEARRQGYLLVGRGSTNAYILEELLGTKIEKERYCAGQVIKGFLCVLGAEERMKPVIIHRGEVLNVEPVEVIDKLKPGDILLKGANAIDAEGNVGVFMAGPTGGTMGQFYLAMKARGLKIVYPVGLEKTVFSVPLASSLGGIQTLTGIGALAGMVCVPNADVYTEIEAFSDLFDVEAVPIAAGGWGGAEGSVTFALEGEKEQISAGLDFLSAQIKGEPPLPAVKSPCQSCPIKCSFQGKAEGELPDFVKR